MSVDHAREFGKRDFQHWRFNFQLLLILKYEKKYAYENTLQFETKNFAIKLQVIIIIS